MPCLFTHPCYSKILNFIMTFFHNSCHKDNCNKADRRKLTKYSTAQFEMDRDEKEYNKDIQNHELEDDQENDYVLSFIIRESKNNSNSESHRQ